MQPQNSTTLVHPEKSVPLLTADASCVRRLERSGVSPPAFIKCMWKQGPLRIVSRVPRKHFVLGEGQLRLGAYICSKCFQIAKMGVYGPRWVHDRCRKAEVNGPCVGGSSDVWPADGPGGRSARFRGLEPSCEKKIGRSNNGGSESQLVGAGKEMARALASQGRRKNR
jgi:hypothetical protein